MRTNQSHLHVAQAARTLAWMNERANVAMLLRLNMDSHGAELILEIARFCSSIARFSEQRGRYEIRGVMGPDQFHDAYPGADAPGLDNNAERRGRHSARHHG